MKSLLSKPITTLFAIALILRIILFLVNFSTNDFAIFPTVYGDDGYVEIAQNILAGNGFAFETEPPYTPNPLRPPLYPLVLAGILALPGSFWLAMILQMLLASTIPVLAYLISKRFVSKKIAFWVGIAMAIEPLGMLFSFVLITETLFIFLFLLSILIFLEFLEKPKLKTAFWLSLIFALGLLVKPVTQYIAFIMPFVLWYHLRKQAWPWKQAAIPGIIFAVVCMVVVSPWLYRNHKQFGVAGMGAQPAFNLATYVVPSVLSFENGTDFRTERDILYASGVDSTKINLSNSKEYIANAVPVILDHPIGLVKTMATSALTFLTHDGMLMVLQYSGIRPSFYLEKPAIVLLINEPLNFLQEMGKLASSPMILVLLVRVIWIGITLLFIYGAFAYIRKNGFTLPITLLLLLVLYFMLTTMANGLGVNGRFRMPVNPLLFMFAFYGISTIYNRLRRARTNTKT